MKAKITITLEGLHLDKDEEILELKREIASGKVQRELSEKGIKCKATFEFIDK